jgi:glycerol-3-phosphate acyltransferase PlsY
MIVWSLNLVGVLIGYLLGSMPSGYLAGRWLKGIDIRQHGSKSTGATNVLRTLGKWPACIVLAVDVSKGAAAILFVRWLCLWFQTLPATAGSSVELQAWMPWAVCMGGMAAILGHSRPIWLNFVGGKSVATGLGVLLAMSWQVGLGALAIFVISLALSRIVSLSSMLAALAAIAIVFYLGEPTPYRLLVIAGGVYVIVRHRSNVVRLLAGREPRLGQSS